MHKLTTIIVLMLLAALTATSCQGQKEIEVKSQPERSEKVIAKTSPWEKAKIDWKQNEGTHLSVPAVGHGPFLAVQPLLPIFEELTGVHVGYQMLDETDMPTKCQIDLSSQGGVYDVIPIGVTYVGEAHANRWLVDLRPKIEDTILTDRQWYDLDDIGAIFRKLVTKDKHLLAILYSSASPIFFYRKDLFTKYHIEIPGTYGDVISMKEKLHYALQKDGITDVYSFTTRAKIGAGKNTWTVIPCIRSYGGGIFDARWKAICNSPRAVEALKTYRDMVTGPGTPPDSESFGIYEMRDMFA